MSRRWTLAALARLALTNETLGATDRAELRRHQIRGDWIDADRVRLVELLPPEVRECIGDPEGTAAEDI